jgi:hypothetical protein
LKKIVLSLLFTLCTLLTFAQVHVSGYYRKNGTYVAPYTRSSPDSSPYDNYSFPGNVNPYTGKVATGNPDTYLRNYYNRQISPRSSSTDKMGESIVAEYLSTFGGSSSATSNNTVDKMQQAKFDRIFDLYERRNKKIKLKSNYGSYTGEYLKLTDEDETVKTYKLYDVNDFPEGTLQVYSNGERILFDNWGKVLKHTKRK